MSTNGAGTAQASETGSGEHQQVLITGGDTKCCWGKQQAPIELKNYLIMILKQCMKMLLPLFKWAESISR